MAYEKSKKEQAAEAKGQRKISNVRKRGQKQVDKMAGASDSKRAELQSKALRLKRREQRLNQRFGQKAGNVGTSRAAGDYGDLDEVVVTAERKQTHRGIATGPSAAEQLQSGSSYTMIPGSREKDTESVFRNPEDLKSRFN